MEETKQYKYNGIPPYWYGTSVFTVTDLLSTQAVILQDVAELIKVESTLQRTPNKPGTWDVLLKRRNKKNGFDFFTRNTNFWYAMNGLEIIIHNYVTTMAISDIENIYKNDNYLYRKIVKAVKNSNYHMTMDVLKFEQQDFIQIRMLSDLEKIGFGIPASGKQYQWVAEKQENSALVVYDFLSKAFEKDHISVSLLNFPDNYYKALGHVKILESKVL